jgi:cytochrome P450
LEKIGLSNYTRAMTRDADIYENPDTFDPERYLDERGNLNADSQVIAYGFGRRYASSPTRGAVK